MDLQRDAQRLIENIRSELSPKSHPKLALLVNNSLEILANEFYDTSTHFLLELIQNADDNDYVCSDPTLKLTYKPGSLRIDCNEIGFTEQNVEALCAIRESTKSGLNHGYGYTGEKGIGFKSVFKAADEVWISSRQYNFKFDKREYFGMIAPTWAEFPEPTSDTLTSIYLKISKDYKPEELVEKLLELDLTLLLFLRKIRNITLYIEQSETEKLTSTLQRIDRYEDEDPIRTLQRGDKKRDYLIREHRVDSLPFEARRPGYSHSELLLAFPIGHGPNIPILGPQNVYAFLPIKDYGFKFFLHGDFLLTANRQLIDTSSLWNQALRDALADAFIQAVSHFNAGSGTMKYLWPYYLPTVETASFFQPTRDSILHRLKGDTILESCGLKMTKAAQLYYVDTVKFADEDGQPFTLCSQTADKYLSAKYPSWAIESLVSLGVRKLTDEQFLDDLDFMISQHSALFRDQSPRWQGQLAHVLLSLTTDLDLLPRMKKLRIIPLSSGEWTSPNDKPAFFQGALPSLLPARRMAIPEDAQNPGNYNPYSFLAKFDSVIASKCTSPTRFENLLIQSMSTRSDKEGKLRLDDFPVNTSVLIIDQVASADGTRHNLYERLGIKDLSPPQMCQQISDSHASPSFKPEQWNKNQLISHINFMYEAHWRSPQDVDLWFATSDDKRCKGSRLYLHSSCAQDSAAARVSQKLTTKYPTIHGDYLADTNEEWMSFLKDDLKLSAIPRLVTPTVHTSYGFFSFSEEFKYLFRECHTADVIKVLNDNWRTYSTWLEPDTTQSQGCTFLSSVISLLHDIQNTVVKTRNGNSSLSKTVFPNLDPFLEEQLPLPILDLEDPRNKLLRQRLSAFGVVVEADIDYYLFCLRWLANQHSPSHEILCHIYERIQLWYDGHEDLVESAFEEEELIYLNSKSSKDHQPIRWVTIDGCVRRKLDPKLEYPQSENLFQCLLSNGSLEVHSLVTKATMINRSYKLPAIVAIFSELNEALEGLSPSRAARALKPLHSKRILPVTKNRNSASYDGVVSMKDTSWFIADRPHLRESFFGKVPLLAFSVNELDAMKDFMKGMLLNPRRLSTTTCCRTTPKGPLKYIESLTHFVRARAGFINVLIPGSQTERNVTMQQMESIRVSTAAKIIQVYELDYEGFSCSGRPCKGHVHASPSGNVLQVFIAEDEHTSMLPSFELIDTIAKHCNIERASHLHLLYTALREKSLQKIQRLFAEEGINVDVAFEDETSSTTSFSNRMTIPSPFNNNSQDSTTNSDDDDSENYDVIRYYRSRSGRKKRQQTKRLMRDRRLRIMGVDDDDNACSHCSENVMAIDPGYGLAYLGQRMTSQLFGVYVGSAYSPHKHWTSELRSRAGIPCLEDYKNASPFTMSDRDASKAVTRFLVKSGRLEAKRWEQTFPTYHFEIAPSTGDWHSAFVCHSKSLERMRSFRHPEGSAEELKHVIILIRVCDIYTTPRFYIVINPWSLFIDGRLTLQGDYGFEAAISRNLPESSNPEHQSTNAAYGERVRTEEPLTLNYWAVNPHHWGPLTPQWTAVGLQAPVSIAPGAMCDHRALLPSKSADYTPVYYNSISQAYSPTYDTTAYNFSFGAPYWQAYNPSSYAQAYAVPLASANTSIDSSYQGTMTSSSSKIATNETYRDNRGSPSITSHSVTSNLPSAESQNLLPFSGNLVSVRGYDRYQYAYRDLEKKAVRLFILFPGKAKEQLRGMICTLPFSEAGSYKTLSYTWGPAAQALHKVVTPEGYITIRESLHSALVRLRPEKDTMVVWIDAICINQADKKEKAKQIRLLPEIFQKTANTLAFLGSDERSDAAIEMLLQVKANREHGSNSDNWPKNLPRIASSWWKTGIPPTDDPIWRDVETLFNHDWFRRAWIVQEAVTSPVVTFICGKWMVDWNELFFAIYSVHEELQLIQNIDSASWGPFLKLASHRVWEARHKRWSLFLLLETFRHVESSLKQDRFFSLLGLANDGHLEEFEPDYESPFEVIARRFAGTLITQGRGIQVLSRAGLGSKPHLFASWVPDWTIPKSGSLSDSLDRGVTYNASGDMESEVRVIAGMDEVHVKAIVADEITTISRMVNEPKQAKKLGQYFKEVDTMIESLSKYYTQTDRNELKWRVPIAGALHPRVAISGIVDIHESYKAMRKILKKVEYKAITPSKKLLLREDDIVSKADASTDGEEMSVREKSLNYLSVLEDGIQGWRFVTTKSGRCGIVSANVEMGDLVTVFAGGDVPFIVRPGTEREGAFRLIGQCYVDGVMDGEAVDDESIWGVLPLY